MKKRILALLMAAMMTVSLAACGGQDETVTEQQQEFVYVPEYIQLENGEYDYINVDGMSRGVVLARASLYDADTGETSQTIIKYDAKEDKTEEIAVKLPKTEEENGDTYVDEYISAVTLDADLNPIVLVSSYVWDGESGTNTYKAYMLDAEGEITNTIPLDELQKASQDEYFYVSMILADDDNTLYVMLDQSVVALDMDGTILFTLDTEGWVQNAGNMPDGSVYVIYYGSGQGNELAVIDKASKAFGTKYELGNYSPSGFFSIEDDCVYFNDSSAVRSFDLETAQAEELFTWLSVDINGDYVNGVLYLDDNTFVSYYNDWSSDESGFVKLVKTESSLVKEKQPLKLAALTNSDVSKEEILAFNKSNDSYRLELKTYLDYNTMSDADWQNYEQFMSDAVTRMLNDITGSNAPDIIAVSASTMSIATLAKQGILEELTPYLEQRGYSEDDFLPGVVNSFKENGKLYTLPGRFSLLTMIANSAVVGEKQGWTLQEALEVLNNLPEGMEFMDSMTQTYFVQMCLTFGYDMYIDRENATCNFDSDEFKAVLELAKQFPEEYEYDEDKPSEPVLASAGEILTITHSISDLQDIQYGYAMFGDNDVTFIGFPGAAGNGTVLTESGSQYAICSKSEHKDAAAEFVLASIIKPYDPDDWNDWGMPTLKTEYEAYITSKTSVDYLKDENGELILDENGDPIPENGTSGIGWGDWEYTYHVCTQEEAEELTELIEGVESRYNYDSTLFSMISEEAEPFFKGQKTVDEAAAIIQNRISLYLSENS